MRKQIVALLAGAMLMMATSSMATMIEGNINFFGSLNLVGGTTLPAATGIHFNNPAFVADGGTGIYAALPSYPSAFPEPATLVTFKDFTFSSVSTTPVTSLWTLTYAGKTYDFDLNSITAITATSISGIGTLGASGYEDTKGLWELTTQSTGTNKLSFSAASTVPEPGTMMLLGLGILGMAIYGKRRMNKEA